MSLSITRSRAATLRKKLLGWHRRFGRDLPWRRTRDPWAVLVSEFMLQQTTVAAVAPRFEAWLGRFPCPAALAGAPEAEVMAMWQGLGYYRRAENLRRAAAAIVARHAGKVPDRLDLLEELPGVGPYTAAAVLAFAFDKPAAVIDTNILRVITRLGNIRLPADSARGRAAVRDLATALLPARGGRRFASALMDLGAIVCTPRQPDCPACPVRALCAAVDPARLPLKAPRPATVLVRERRALFHRDGAVALQRSNGPRWGGLWLLPVTAWRGTPVLRLAYSVTKFRIRMELVEVRRQPPGTRLFPLGQLPPMPSPHARAVRRALLSGCTGSSSPGSLRR